MGKRAYLEAGRTVGTHGVRGEMRLEVWCDSPDQLKSVHAFYADEQGGGKVAVTCRPHQKQALVKMEGVDTLEAADALRGRVWYLDRRDLKLPQGAVFIDDLIGMTVKSETDGVVLGTVTDVTRTGSNDVYWMKTPDGRDILIPAIPSVVRKIDAETDTVTVFPMKGLLDDESV